MGGSAGADDGAFDPFGETSEQFAGEFTVSGVEQNALQSLLAFEEQPTIGRIAVFPDIHYCSERSIPVGVAFETTDVFYPLVTGKDMGPCKFGLLQGIGTYDFNPVGGQSSE